MTQPSCAKKAGKVFIYLVAVTTVAAVAFVFCRQQNIIQCQKEIQSSIAKIAGRLDVLESNGGNLAKEIESSYNLADQVSAALGIITAGITVFTLFGGILTILNLIRAKELDEAISKAEEAQENQEELIGARLLQDGLVYVSRHRPYYACQTFEKVIQKVSDTAAALTARYEILSLYADAKGVSLDSDRLQMTLRCFNELKSALDQADSKIDPELCYHLRGDAFFMLGCAFGQFALTQSPPDPYHINASIDFLKTAIRYNSQDVEYHKNLAYTYAMAGKKDLCREALESAIACAEQEPLNAVHVSQKRLRALFAPIEDTLPIDFQEMLNEMFAEQEHP